MAYPIEKIRNFILKNISKHSSDIVAVTMKKFGLTRPGVHRHLKKLIQEGVIGKTGITRKTKYMIIGDKTIAFTMKINPNLQEDIVWKEKMEPHYSYLPKNILSILYFGFTEMFNNVLDHSSGTHVIVRSYLTGPTLHVDIEDNGIGIFKKIAQANQLQDLRESIVHLAKGKVTTSPENHTGEGIFFTSRAFDRFNIYSDNLHYQRRNDDKEDWLLSYHDQNVKGTLIKMTIRINAKTILRAIFDKYSDPETYKFDKTIMKVQLAKFEEESMISRSQAKRLLLGLEKFKTVILDFMDVTTVGQGFVDEVFRIFKRNHPEIQIEYINANENVEFMIKRSVEING